jgi:hypothetical protein
VAVDLRLNPGRSCPLLDHMERIGARR